MLLRAILLGQLLAFVDSEMARLAAKRLPLATINIRMPQATTFSLFFYL